MSDLPPSALWIRRFTEQHYAPRETPQNLHNMVEARCRTSRKHKRNNEHDQPPIDVDTWLQEAWQANDTKAMHWFTRTILHQTTTTTPSRKKPRIVNVLHIRWTTLVYGLCVFGPASVLTSRMVCPFCPKGSVVE